MTTTIEDFRYGISAQDDEGALVRAYSRQLATVVSVSGVVDDHNLNQVLARVERHVLDDDFILDLGGLDAVSAETRDVVCAVEHACRAAGVQWVLVAADEVVDGLNLDADQVTCAVAQSVREALRFFADVSGVRRRILLPLLGRTA
jgi:anti-anti-sigma regulatory factor